MAFNILFQILNYSALIATLSAVWFLSVHKYKICFAISVLSCIFWIIIAYKDNVWSLLILNIIQTFLYAFGYFKKDKKCQNAIPDDNFKTEN